MTDLIDCIKVTVLIDPEKADDFGRLLQENWVALGIITCSFSEAEQIPVIQGRDHFDRKLS